MLCSRKNKTIPNRWRRGLSALVFTALVFTCGSAIAQDHHVVVSILPWQWLVEQVGGDLVSVEVLVGPGHSPATYEPTPRQMARLQDAAVFFTAGVPFERGLGRRIAGLSQRPAMYGPRVSAGSHDHHGHSCHNHGDIDPHNWLDPSQAMALADTIYTALITLAPDQKDALAARRDTVHQQLASLDAEIREILAPYAGQAFFVFHPAFGHFATAYGLRQVAVEAGGHEPSARQLGAVIDQAKAAGARAIIVQPQFSRKAAKSVAQAIDAELVPLDPLSDDYIVNLRHIAQTLADLFRRTETRK